MNPSTIPVERIDRKWVTVPSHGGTLVGEAATFKYLDTSDSGRDEERFDVRVRGVDGRTHSFNADHGVLFELADADTVEQEFTRHLHRSASRNRELRSEFLWRSAIWTLALFASATGLTLALQPTTIAAGFWTPLTQILAISAGGGSALAVIILLMLMVGAWTDIESIRVRRHVTMRRLRAAEQFDTGDESVAPVVGANASL